MRVYFEAFGCTLNKGESHRMAEMAREEGFLVTESVDESDCVVISTCTVIETTERKMIKRISELAGLNKSLIVSGCMAEIQREKVRSVAPSSRFLPIDEIDSLARVLRDLGIRVGSGSSLKPPMRSVDVAIPIAQGCLGRCTYCATRLARGKLRSRRIEDVMEDVERALGRGFREIRLCAQDTAAYGIDNSSSLVELLDSLSSMPGDFRIRVGMMNPSTLDGILDDVIEAFHQDRIYKFLHLPVQSGGDVILELMHRSYSVDGFERLVERFRQVHRDLTLSTDIIVGFPGEDDEEFQRSLELVKRIEPDLLNITRFSARKGTAAYEMSGRVEGWMTKNRSRALTKLRSELGTRRNERLIGSTQEVLLTEIVKEGSTVGRTIGYKPVVLEGELPLGAFVRAKIVGAEDAYLWGEVV
ncbi:MAG: tRNA (N(6)-L-threonylcarbamoyladenosine(37)-C(2))-methylthiotransferase [Thermoplasmata archaeon]